MLITIGNADKLAYLKYYLHNFLGHVLDAVEQLLKDKHIDFRGMSLAQLHAYILETWQEHCLERRVNKYFKRHQGMYSTSFCKDVERMHDWGCGAHNRFHLHEPCKCKKKKKGFYTSSPRYHPNKPYKYKRKHGYHKFEKIYPSKFQKSQSKCYVKRRT